MATEKNDRVSSPTQQPDSPPNPRLMQAESERLTKRSRSSIDRFSTFWYSLPAHHCGAAQPREDLIRDSPLRVGLHQPVGN
jgi:hypothetical protein